MPADAREAEPSEKPAEFGLGSPKADAVAEARQAGHGQDGLAGVEFPRMKINHSGSSLACSLLESPAEDPHGKQAKITTAPDRPVGSCETKRQWRDLQQVSPRRPDRTVDVRRRIGDAVPVVVNRKNR